MIGKDCRRFVPIRGAKDDLWMGNAKIRKNHCHRKERRTGNAEKTLRIWGGRDETRVSRPKFIINDITPQLDASSRFLPAPLSDSCAECPIQLCTRWPLPPITLAWQSRSLRSPLPGHSTAATARGWRPSINEGGKKDGGGGREGEREGEERRAVLTSQSWPAPNGQLIVVQSLGELVALLQQQTTGTDKERGTAKFTARTFFGGEVVTEETIVRKRQNVRRLIRLRWRS